MLSHQVAGEDVLVHEDASEFVPLFGKAFEGTPFSRHPLFFPRPRGRRCSGGATSTVSLEPPRLEKISSNGGAIVGTSPMWNRIRIFSLPSMFPARLPATCASVPQFRIRSLLPFGVNDVRTSPVNPSDQQPTSRNPRFHDPNLPCPGPVPLRSL